MNEITRDNIGDWIGKKVEVSEGGTAWLTYTLCGFNEEENTYVVATPHVYVGWRICRPLQPKRRVPTDQDAAQWPRLKCWVRNDNGLNWKEAVLLSVEKWRDFNFHCKHSGPLLTDYFRYCEIEDKP